jgi:hypothetical protein
MALSYGAAGVFGMGLLWLISPNTLERFVGKAKRVIDRRIQG